MNSIDPRQSNVSCLAQESHHSSSSNNLITEQKSSWNLLRNFNEWARMENLQITQKPFASSSFIFARRVIYHSKQRAKGKAEKFSHNAMNVKTRKSIQHSFCLLTIQILFSLHDIMKCQPQVKPIDSALSLLWNPTLFLHCEVAFSSVNRSSTSVE